MQVMISDWSMPPYLKDLPARWGLAAFLEHQVWLAVHLVIGRTGTGEGDQTSRDR
jgi:hypothetical protein